MYNLLLAILFSSFLYLIFKLFSEYKINTLQAIVFNYIIAFFVGYLINPVNFSISKSLSAPWIFGAMFLGIMFICVFNVLAKTTQINSISVASVASKMSMIIPILFGIFIFNENIGICKLIGIIIALLAVYFTSKKENGEAKISNFTLPILLFLGAGIIDTSMNYIQRYYVKEEETNMFTSFTFIFAFIFGLLYLFKKSFKQKNKIHYKSILAGFILGIPNYFSMFYLIKALQNKNIESATIFTLINIGVILLTTVYSLIIFKEKIKKQNFIGILLAIVAVLLVTQ
ncbi:MAG: DMT family transporter [Flavobacterium sp.]|jgi:drug/metabolite transporter (DMT)-like permease